MMRELDSGRDRTMVIVARELEEVNLRVR